MKSFPKGNLWIMDFIESTKRETANITIKAIPASMQQWHDRMGHLPIDTIELTAKHSDGMELTDGKGTNGPSNLCEPCLKGGMQRLPFGHHE